MWHDDLFGEVISTYARSQAIEDGTLINVSEMAKKSGFKIPVAMTRAVWDQYIEWSREDTIRQTMQEQSARLLDVLWMLYFACKRNKDGTCIQFKLRAIPRDGHSKSPVLVRLKSVIGGGDDGGEPVITIMLPNED